MNTIISEIKHSRVVGKLGSLCIISLECPSQEQPEYRLLDGKALESVEITEVSEAGSIDKLKIKNNMDSRLFLMEGQELVGGKQNRILNTDVLVAAQSSTLEIPVCCVEEGRWGYKTRKLKPGRLASIRTRMGNSHRITRSRRERGVYDADQHEVWSDIQRLMRRSGRVSSTSSLHDLYASHREKLESERQALDLPEYAVGLAVVRDEMLQGLDIFNRHETLKYYWGSLLDSYSLDQMLSRDQAVDENGIPSEEILEEVLHQAREADWELFDTPGEGRELRLDSHDLTGSALVWNQTIVHMQLFEKPA